MKHHRHQGLIDLDAEIAKCEKKLQLARLNLDKVRKVEAQPDYAETVPENVRSINEDKVRAPAKCLSCAISHSLFTFPAEENVRSRGLYARILKGYVCKVEIDVYTLAGVGTMITIVSDMGPGESQFHGFLRRHGRISSF